ncbi:hypothetical protein RUM44_007608 [Polyplax serrata]|uniref:Uncharacterized protein n=1 Tax=Polyplax serrata TaxID=468196 RepID=A0ABR1B7Y3_POLSC
MAKLLHFEVIQNGFVISVVFFQDAETIERLNEMGELRTILKPYKCFFPILNNCLLD